MCLVYFAGVGGGLCFALFLMCSLYFYDKTLCTLSTGTISSISLMSPKPKRQHEKGVLLILKIGLFSLLYTFPFN